MLPVTTPLPKEAKLMCQGRPVAVSENVTRAVRPSGPVQWVKVNADIEPAPEPESPLPVLSVPLAVMELHVVLVPVLVSVKGAFVAFAVTAPPGLMVHVVAANAAVAPSMAASTAAEPAIRGRA